MSVSKSSAAEQAGHTTPDLELVNYGAGYAWLRPDHERAELDAAIRDAAALDYDMTRTLGWPEGHRALQERIALTDAGRDALAREQAMEAAFGPWPTVAEAVQSTRRSCGGGRDREHNDAHPAEAV